MHGLTGFNPAHLYVPQRSRTVAHWRLPTAAEITHINTNFTETSSPTCGDGARRVMKESKHGQTCTISRRGGWGGSAHPLFSSCVPFSTFLFSPYSIYHLLRRLKYFITSRFVYSKFCLFWYQYQRNWRLLLSQLGDLCWWPQGALFSTSVCNWRLKEEKNQPALMIKQAETEDAPQIGGKKMFLCFFEHDQAGERWLNWCCKDREKCLCSWYLLSSCAYFILYLLCVCYFRHCICPRFYQRRER